MDSRYFTLKIDLQQYNGVNYSYADDTALLFGGKICFIYSRILYYDFEIVIPVSRRFQHKIECDTPMSLGSAERVPATTSITLHEIAALFLPAVSRRGQLCCAFAREISLEKKGVFCNVPWYNYDSGLYCIMIVHSAEAYERELKVTLTRCNSISERGHCEEFQPSTITDMCEKLTQENQI
ncbi:hypothetical protein ANN_14949 [Periplaneta americana]|uniref:Uncharacterized protein n=1 Tax=Periplaneta americana TaxID=6978 RepID=A0ABQ8SYU9_PERAM|nr:hypothetical protein ANN_14949 [Periplaneta americana]